LLQKQTHQAMLQMNANKIVDALPLNSDPTMAFQAQQIITMADIIVAKTVTQSHALNDLMHECNKSLMGV
jgi:hypothetical protein